MKQITKNNKLVYGILLLVAFIASTSVTYAFFSLTVTGNENAEGISAEAGTLSLVYRDRSEITGTFETSYNIIFKDLINGIEQNELVVSYTCLNKKNKCLKCIYSFLIGLLDLSNLVISS